MAEAYYTWERAEERSLARFVREDLPPALRLPAYINRLDLLARKGPVGLMEQLYSVLHDQGIRYDLAPFDPRPGITQRIRKPETILAEKTGTCLDLAVLFAGMYLANDLLPLIVLVEGHAFAGVSRTRTRRDPSRRAGAFAFTRGYLNDLNRLRELARSEYVFVECTGCAQSTAALDARYPEGRGREASGYMSFERACEAGMEQVLQHMRAESDPAAEAQRTFLYALDIHDLQVNYGIEPRKEVEAMGQEGTHNGGHDGDTRGPAVPDWLIILTLPELRNPTGIAAEGSTLYVADHSYGHVLRIDRGQVVGQFAGLDRPHHVAVMNGFLLVADSHHNRVVCLDAGFQEVWSRRQFGQYRLARPHGVAQNTPEEFYVLSSDNHCLLFVSHGKVRAAVRNASRLPSAEPGQFSTPCGIGLGPRTVYVADTFNHRIQVFTSDLHYITHFGTFGYGFGEFAYPVGVANWHEWLVIADEHNQRLQLWRIAVTQKDFTASCVAERVCADWLASPFGVAFNPYGTLYVADRKGGKVLEIDFQGLLSGLTASPRARQSAS